jgi:quercetin dioxygenase-like cupin family protein
MTDSIRRLEELTSTLPPFPQPVKESTGFKQHAMECGTSFSWSLLDEPDISAANWFNSSGTRFPRHAHKQTEYLIVYKGTMFLTVGAGEEKQLGPGESAHIPPSTLHMARFLEDCWYVAICIPQNPDWPKPQG